MADQPPEVVLQADRRRHQENISLANLSRRLKKKLLEDPGERPDPPPLLPAEARRADERCGVCKPCLGADCGTCRTCQKRRVETRKEKSAAVEVCQAAARWCPLWGPAPQREPSLAGSSIVSLASPDTLMKSTKDLEEQLNKLGDTVGDLVVAIKGEGAGPWTSRPDLHEEALEKWLETRQEDVDQLVERAQSRQSELERLLELEEVPEDADNEGEYVARNEEMNLQSLGLPPGRKPRSRSESFVPTTTSRFAAQLQREMEVAAASRSRQLREAAGQGDRAGARSSRRHHPGTLAPPNTGQHNSPRSRRERTGFSPGGDTFRSEHLKNMLLQREEDRLVMPPPVLP